MPWFYFDLITDNRAHDQGGMILEDEDGAKERAEALATELRKVRPELQEQTSFVRVIDEANQEIYRVSLHQPTRSIKTTQH